MDHLQNNFAAAATTELTANSLIAYIPSIHALVCRPCGFVVPRDALHRHLRDNENHGIHGRTIADVLSEIDNRHPRTARSFHPSLAETPLPHLPILTGYIRCQLPSPFDREATDDDGVTRKICTYITKNSECMKAHCRKVHKTFSRKRGRPKGNKSISGSESPALWRLIHCQRLRTVNQGSLPFEVLALSAQEVEDIGGNKGCETSSCSLEQQIMEQLKMHKQRRASSQMPASCTRVDTIERHLRSDWLNLTQWPTVCIFKVCSLTT